MLGVAPTVLKVAHVIVVGGVAGVGVKVIGDSVVPYGLVGSP